MNAVAFITDFICKDNTSSLDGFCALLIIAACFSSTLLHYLVRCIVRAAAKVIYYLDRRVSPDLGNTGARENALWVPWPNPSSLQEG